MRNQPVYKPKTPGNRLELRRLWLPVFMMASISILSGSAGIQLEGWSFVGIDKLGHLVVFGLLGIAWIRSFHENVMGEKQRFIYAVFLTTVFGLIDEMHQYHNPLRTFEWADLFADFAGSIIACCVYIRMKPVRKILETEISQYLRLPSRNKTTDSPS